MTQPIVERGLSGDRAGMAAAPLPAAAPVSHLRAGLAFLFVTGAGILLVTQLDRVAAVVGLTSESTIATVVVPVALILLALASGALFGQRFAIGRERPVWTAAALPSGVAAMTLILLPVALLHGIGAGAGKVGLAGVLIGTPFVLLAAFSEEILLRGALQPVLERAWGLWPALGLSAGSFTVMHVAGGWSDPITLANIFLASIWFGLLAERTGGLLAPTLAHFGYNWSEELLFGASPNPGVGPHGALFDIDLIGSVRLGGSADGMNASPILGAVLLLLIALLAWDVRRRPRADRGAVKP